ncbi:phosphoribosyltransferase family protein [Streptococcus dentasini]
MLCLICGNNAVEKRKFTDLLLLPNEKSGLCTACWSSFEQISSCHCPLCWKAGENSICQDCQYWQNLGQQVSHEAIFTYNQAMKDYFSAYKFQGDYLLRKVFSEILRTRLAKYRNYIFVPIPLSQMSYKERRFNQVQGLLDAANLPYKDLLLITENKKARQSDKSRKERLQTPQFFSLKGQSKLPQNILLVDDIYTTGKTLMLAKEALSEKGVKTIKSFSLAR